MKIYQLAGHGHWMLNHAQYTAFSDDVYRTEEAAKKAIPEYFKYLTTPKREGDNMVLDPKGLRIFIHPLNLKNKKSKRKNKQND